MWSEGTSQEGLWLGLHFLLPSLGLAVAYKLGQGGGLEALEASLSLGVCLWVPAGREMNQCVRSPCYPRRPPRLSRPLGWCWGQAGGAGRERRGSRWLAVCPALPAARLSLEAAGHVLSALGGGDWIRGDWKSWDQLVLIPSLLPKAQKGPALSPPPN